jgi:hypothetical protein
MDMQHSAWVCIGAISLALAGLAMGDRQDNPKRSDQPKGATGAKQSNPLEHDTPSSFEPAINGPIDRATGRRRRIPKKTRIKRYRDGKKEVTFPPSRTVYPLDPVAGAGGQATTPSNPNVKVSGYVHTVGKDDPNPPAAGDPDDPAYFHGNMIMFCVDGCKDATFYQFARQTFTFSNRAQPGSNTSWNYDTSDQQKGPYGNVPDKPAAGAAPEPAMFDAPGQWGPPDHTVPPLAVPPHAGDAETRTDEFETFVCCDKKLIGFWTWTQTLIFTWEKTSNWSAPSVTPASPTWNNDPTTGGDPFQLMVKGKICGAK